MRAAPPSLAPPGTTTHHHCYTGIAVFLCGLPIRVDRVPPIEVLTHLFSAVLAEMCSSVDFKVEIGALKNALAAMWEGEMP
jgi:hypothetical protein